MNSVLHLTSRERSQLYQAASQQLGFGEVIIEKDFWVCWTLQQLFTLPDIGNHLIFKGGTSLSKVWKAIARFSEDIDVSLNRDWLGFTGENDPEKATSGKKQRAGIHHLLEACIKKIELDILPALKNRAAEIFGEEGWAIEIDANDPQTLHFKYPSVVSNSELSAYIRREVKIEFGARSDAWPAEDCTILPYVAEAYPLIITDATVGVRVLSIERTFWEKATILHAEAHRENQSVTPSRYSRHYADLAALADHASATTALADEGLRKRVVEHKQIFFHAAWAHYDRAVPGTFRLLPFLPRLAALESDYRDMQEMFFGTPLPWNEVIERLARLETAINNL